MGSARLTFGDDRYYEFMCFDVPKVVWSPRCDHGYDEESRNGRDMKIDILDDYIRTPEWFELNSLNVVFRQYATELHIELHLICRISCALCHDMPSLNRT